MGKEDIFRRGELLIIEMQYHNKRLQETLSVKKVCARCLFLQSPSMGKEKLR